MGGLKILSQDFKEFLESLNLNEVRSLVIGSYAMAFHNSPRFTKDLDVWLECSPENAKKVLKALVDFGFGTLDLAEADFSTPKRVIQLGYPPQRIDLLTSAAGVDFDECYLRRNTALIDGIQVAYIDIEGLKANKRATGRLQDLADVERLDSDR
jgi:hypothetical protein